MLSINTNISSLIAQNSLKDSTSILNLAVERMTTGFKINHAKDNAANYSISTNMQTQIQSYDVAADNVAMGMDLVTTSSDIISNMQDKANRLQSLCIQARNGTYGASSMAAINSEASAIMAEINRLYSTAEYNNISLFNRKAYEIADHLPQAGASGFIEEPITTFAMRAAATPSTPVAKEEYNGFIAVPKTYTDEEVAAMTRVKDVSTFSSGQKYAIYTKEELQKLADYVNGGNNTTNVEFVLGADIDLSSISNWTPIGYDYDHSFKGTFDGNGQVIKNLTIDNPTQDYQGLFGYASSFSKIKNVGVENCDVKGDSKVGGLVGNAAGELSNSYATGNVSGNDSIGGLIGIFFGEHPDSPNIIKNSYTECIVNGNSDVGGLIGNFGQGPTCYFEISNSYAMGDVTGSNNLGGLVGKTLNTTITNSYATGDVSGNDSVGGLVGTSSSSDITNSYATGNVTGDSSVGGLAGSSYSSVSNSYATGNVSGNGYVGGLIGYASREISNSYATGNVTGDSSVGGLAGSSYSSVSNSYATGDVSGNDSVGGLVGTSSSDITNSYATGNVTGDFSVGGLAGSSYSSVGNSYATGNVSGNGYVGGLIGYASREISNSYATGNVTGDSSVGGLAGSSYSSVSNSYATGNVCGVENVGGLVGMRSEGEFTYTNCYTTGNVTGETNVGGMIGYANAVSYRPTTLLLDNCSTYSMVTGQNNVSSLFNANTDYTNTTFSLLNVQYIAQEGVEPIVTSTAGYDLSTVLVNVSQVEFKNISTNLLVGINGDSSCQIGFDTNFDFDLSAIGSDISSDSALACINDFLTLLSEKSTMLGAVENRLNSALDSIEVNLTNLTSSLSTIRDADIAEVSSTYIQQQILQQAASTLLATANQSPSIALQLI